MSVRLAGDLTRRILVLAGWAIKTRFARAVASLRAALARWPTRAGPSPVAGWAKAARVARAPGRRLQRQVRQLSITRSVGCLAHVTNHNVTWVALGAMIVAHAFALRRALPACATRLADARKGHARSVYEVVTERAAAARK